jgi:Pyruvate/2-oxoacid:ferredoxin oxidoreductase delta subunit
MSMMSTGATNIGGVNCFDEMFAYAMMRKRGRGEKVFLWPIEMNQAREHYLSTYNAVDRIDHRVRNLHLKLRSWKYWHSPMVHAMGLGVVTCYDMYLEVCEGKLDGFPKVKHPMSLKDFQSKLGLALLSYHPKNRILKGDEKLRQYTQVPKQHRPPETPRKRSHEDIVSKEAYLAEKNRQTKGKKARFCPDGNCLIYHMNYRTQLANPKNCGVCNKPCYTACGLCFGSDKKPLPLHFPNNRSKTSDGNCVVMYHSKYYFGLCAKDLPVRGWARKDWKPPTQAVYNANKKAIDQYENPAAAAAEGEAEQQQQEDYDDEEEYDEVGEMEAI